MNIVEKFSRSWQLFRASVSVLQQNPKLMVFPVVTTVFTAVILLFFMSPLALQPTGYRYTQPQHWQAVWESVFQGDSAPVDPSSGTSLSDGSVPATPPSTTHHRFGRVHRSGHGGADSENNVQLTPLGMAYLATAYLVSMVLATYFNVAFYHEILASLRGDGVSIRRGLLYALTRWQAVLLWASFAGLVGLVIRQLEERVGIIGKLVLGLVGTAWSVASIFVIPVVVTDTESVNPLHMLKKSALTLKQTWGEALIGFAGVRLGGLVLTLGSFVFLGLALAVSVVTENFWIIGVTGALWLVGMIVFSYVISVANHVYRCALYLYSTEQTIVQPYNLEMLQMAWKMKKSK